MADKYDKYPLPSTVHFFKNATGNHSRVKSVTEISEYFYEIERIGLPALKVVLSNIYILGEADVHELLAEYKGVECIVVGSNWNRYSGEAKQLATACNVGLFQFGEFFGAINHEGDKFLNYVTPEPRKK
jgi:hypothetical protein